MKPYQAAVLGGTTVFGIGLLIYYLIRERNKEKRISKGHELASLQFENEQFSIHNSTKEQVLKILKGIHESQEEMKSIMRKLTAEFSGRQYTFDEVYFKVKERLPDDPLEQNGLSMVEFDQLLIKYEHDDVIKNLVAKIMIPTAPKEVSKRVVETSVETVIEIHTYMLEIIKKLAEDFKNLQNYSNFEMKSVTIAMQVIAAIEVEKKYKLNMEETEYATLSHHLSLAESADFAVTTCEMQNLMGQLVTLQGCNQFY